MTRTNAGGDGRRRGAVLPAVLARLAWAGLGLAAWAGLGLFVAGHPLGSGWILAGLALFAALLAWRREVWLLWLPGLLPVADLAPWTGMIHFTESDALVLCTLAVFGLREALRPAVPAARDAWGIGLLPMLAVLLMAASYAVSTAWSPLAELGRDPNLLVGYDSPLNGVRLVKGFFFALLLLPLLATSFRADPLRAQARLTQGMLLGLALVVLAAVWERLAFPGLSDFSSDYRTTALFWEMNTGGAQLDGWLALTLPFLVWSLLRNRSPLALLGLSALAILAGYAVFTTFSRGLYAGVVVAAVCVVGMHALLREGSGGSPLSASRLALALSAALLFGGLLDGVFLAGGYRGMAAVLGVAAAVFPAAPALAHLSRRSLGLALALALAGCGLGLAMAALHPKGDYLAYGLALLALAGAWRMRAGPGAAVLPAVLLWLAFEAVRVSVHWGGADALAPALAALAAALAPALLLRLRPDWSWQPLPRGFAFVVLGLGAVAAAVVMLNAHYSSKRLESTGEDLVTRQEHWAHALSLPTADERWLGIGTGQFPERYFWTIPGGAFPGKHRIETEAGQRFLRLSGPRRPLSSGQLYRVAQRVDRDLTPPFVLSARLRAPDGEAYLHVDVCRKQLIYPMGCVAAVQKVPGGTEWRRQEMVLAKGKLGAGGDILPRLTFLSLANETHGRRLDLDDLSVVDAGGRELVANGDFAQAGERWFFTSDRHHLPWHAKNLWLHYLVEQGWLGLAAFSLLGLAAVARLGLERHALPVFAPALAGSLAGISVVGAFDSVVDAPRLTLTLFLLLFVALGMRRPAQPAR